jgi:hypothetical protein
MPDGFKVIKKWRKAISLVERPDGTLAICRYHPKKGKWLTALYFTTEEDFDDFITFLDEAYNEVSGANADSEPSDEAAA